jgi:hypothetical protein
MKPKVLLILSIGIALGGSPAPTFAQAAPPPTLTRGDVAGIVGWQNINKSDVSGQSGNNWYNRGLYGSGAFGWYWTDNHKTEIEVGASTRARFQTYGSYSVENQIAYGSSEYTFRTRQIAIDQQYQFFHNAWFHPHVAAGADLNWETTTEKTAALFAYTGPSGSPRTIRPAQVEGPDTRLRVRPFGEVGFKAYATPRAFFRTDLRVLARRGIDEVQVRLGLGFDF